MPDSSDSLHQKVIEGGGWCEGSSSGKCKVELEAHAGWLGPADNDAR